MSIRRFFNQDVILRRLSTVSGYKKSYQSTATVEAHIQAMSKEARQTLGILEEKAWIAWFDVDTNINEKDVLIDDQGTEYEVREVVRKAYGVNQHKECVLMEKNA